MSVKRKVTVPLGNSETATLKNDPSPGWRCHASSSPTRSVSRRFESGAAHRLSLGGGVHAVVFGSPAARWGDGDGFECAEP
jgi:hypothetical protein